VDAANTSAGGTHRPGLAGPPSADCKDGNLTGRINAVAFALCRRKFYRYGTAGRNLLYGPHLFTTYLSLFKISPIRELARFELRFEDFNVTNSPEFSNPGFNNPGATFGTATFGSVTWISIDNRDFQLGTKLVS
jgi:hypothetical protein